VFPQLSLKRNLILESEIKGGLNPGIAHDDTNQAEAIEFWQLEPALAFLGVGKLGAQRIISES
jgi:hypothetical protein